MTDENNPKNQIVVYQSDDGKIKLDVNLQNETLWLSQAQIGQLYGKAVSTISEHISNIFSDKEVNYDKNTKKESNFGNPEITSYKPTLLYSLDLILAVGYRVNSAVAIKFRQWATQTLKEYIIKGFVMNDEKLANGERLQSPGYFNELVERVRKIRLSESLLYEKVTDLFAIASYDYDPRSEEARNFFSTIQNKFHYAVSEQTSAEIIVNRIDSDKPRAGLITTKHVEPTLEEAKVAKNYLDETELKQLYLISEQFLSMAELKATRKTLISMQDWVQKLDELLRINDLAILQDKGSVSRSDMEKYVKKEIEKYRQKLQIEMKKPKQIEDN